MNKQNDNRKVILLLEEDYQTGLLLIEFLRKQNYRVIIVPDEQGAIDWLETTIIEPCLFLINQVGLPISQYCDNFERIIGQTKLSYDIPLVIMIENYEDETLQGTQRQIGENQYVIYLESPEQLNQLIHHLCGA